MTLLQKSAFPKSRHAAHQITHSGELQLAFLEAHQAPENKKEYLGSGNHPFSVWISHLGITDDRLPDILGIDRAEYHALRHDSIDGQFHKTTPEMVVNFCRYIKVHPAHLESLDPDFRQSLHPSVLMANILVANDVDFCMEDRALASYAIEIESRRYRNSFLADPKFGRVGEKLEDFFHRRCDAVMDGALHHGGRPWVWDNMALIACEECAEAHQNRFDSTKSKIINLNEGLVDAYVDILTAMKKSLGFDVAKFFPAGLIKRCLDMTEGQKYPTQKEVAWILRDTMKGLILEGENRCMSHAKKNGVRYRKEFALDAEAESLAGMITPYLHLYNETTQRLEPLEQKQMELKDELANVKEWVDILSSGKRKDAQTVSRLFTNRMLIAEYDEEKIKKSPVCALLQGTAIPFGSVNPT